MCGVVVVVGTGSATVVGHEPFEGQGEKAYNLGPAGENKKIYTYSRRNVTFEYCKCRK